MQNLSLAMFNNVSRIVSTCLYSCYESTITVLYDYAVGVLIHSAACGRYIDASSHLFDIHYDTTQGFKHGKNMYISKTFESRHGPYNI